MSRRASFFAKLHPGKRRVRYSLYLLYYLLYSYLFPNLSLIFSFFSFFLFIYVCTISYIFIFFLFFLSLHIFLSLKNVMYICRPLGNGEVRIYSRVVRQLQKVCLTAFDSTYNGH